MRETIYTIPISEVFEPKCGCPICRLHDILEERCIDYIMGAAMMEPDVRIETNKVGFCRDHLAKMLPRKNRLALGLLLETHLKELSTKYVTEKAFGAKGLKSKESPALTAQSCFVCNELKQAIDKILANVCSRYFSDSEFAELYRDQPMFCFEHYQMLCTTAYQSIGKKYAALFVKDTTDVMQRYLGGLIQDVEGFCKSFDYRNSQKPQEESVKTAVERSAAFLTGLKSK